MKYLKTIRNKVQIVIIMLMIVQIIEYEFNNLLNSIFNYNQSNIENIINYTQNLNCI